MKNLYLHHRFLLIFFASLILLIILFFLNLFISSTYISPIDVIKGLFGQSSDNINIIIQRIRLPRAIATIFIGATLAAGGALIKAVMRNPLADTGLLGLQSGASTVALLIILVYPSFYYFLPFGAFIGGMFAYMLVFLISYKKGIAPLRLVLTGVAVNALFGGIISIINILNSDKIGLALGWLNGSFSKITLSDARLIVIYSTVLLIIALLVIRKCNLLLLDDHTIINLGINISLIRFIVATIAVFLASVSVVFVGIIGFVGLIVPHIARLIIGANYKYLLPLSMIFGSCLISLSDLVAKSAFSPIEIPVGIIISFIGAPFFLFLLRKEF